MQINIYLPWLPPYGRGLVIQLLKHFFYPVGTRKMRSLASLVRLRPSSFSFFSLASQALQLLLLLCLWIKLEIISQYFTDAHKAFISLKCILNATNFIVILFFSKNHHFTNWFCKKFHHLKEIRKIEKFYPDTYL